MKIRTHLTLWLLTCLLTSTLCAETFIVTSAQEFNTAHSQAAAGDEIVWPDGVYPDVVMRITKSDLTVRAENLGGTVFNGFSRAEIDGDNIDFIGFQYVGGNLGTADVVSIRGSNIKFNQVNIRAYTCYKYLRVREESQYVDISYCNFENRLNVADQNILSILVDNNQPGYHKIRHCSFKNFPGGGNDEGVEPIRIGVSSQADFISRTLVEYCYFTKCDGDGEIISSKATQNVYRFNTFENNTKAELVLRHGSQAIVYGNFFLNGKGGVRVREGQNHYIYNNYFNRLEDRAIFLQNERSDPLDNINIAFNTIVDCDEVLLGGGSGSFPPTNVTLANNIITAPNEELFESATGNETWIGNIGFGTLGINLPASGLTLLDPQLEENAAGYFGLAIGSPAINAALPGYAELPQFPGMDTIDTDILFDLMGQARPAMVTEKDLGANEFPHNIEIRPIATEENTGPDYNTTTATRVSNQPVVIKDAIRLFPNPVDKVLTLTIDEGAGDDITVDLLDFTGRKLNTLHQSQSTLSEVVLQHSVDSLPAGLYTVRATGQKAAARWIQTIQFVKR
ncbi:chondroitinase-B domain-containing protein [Neolewinella persica]|uniref:chondroitinase-B domain-containing protein n=1 Tax=Neolewinella persica TaxID=70998 RepID=UPI00146B422D|nr:chondroitinase-B domain-containing protein [Neolewinella persica]